MHCIHASHALYMTCHILCIISHSLYVWYHTVTVSMTSHSMFMTYPPYMASHTVLWQHNHCVISQPQCLTSHPLYLHFHTQCINFIKPSVCMSSQPLYVWHHMHYIWHHIHSLWYHTTLFMTSCPLYLTSHPPYLTSCPLYLCHHTHSIEDITVTICMVSHPGYVWHHIHYIYDIISTMLDITTLCVDDTTLGIGILSFALQMISHPLYNTKLQYLWFHIHSRHDITPTVSDIAPTVSLSSQSLQWYHTQLYMTSNPPYVWHHMHYI